MCFFSPEHSDSRAEEVGLASTAPWAPPLQQSTVRGGSRAGNSPAPPSAPVGPGGQQGLGLCGTWSWVLEEGADLPSTLLRSGCLGLLVGFVLFVCSATP